MRKAALVPLMLTFVVASGCNSGGTSPGLAGMSQVHDSPIGLLPLPLSTPSPPSTPNPTPSLSPVPYAYSSGNGTVSSPYSLRTASDIQHIQDNLSAYFSLDEDVLMDGVAMTPIGSVEHPFSGILYGNNHSISDVRMSSSNGATIAFFGAVSGTVVELGLGNLNMSSNGYAAGLVGTLSGFISGCGVGGTITSGLGGNGYNTGTGNVLAVTVLNTATIYNSTEGGTFNGNKILATLNFGPMLPTPYSCKSGTCTVVSYVCSGPTLAIDCVPGS